MCKIFVIILCSLSLCLSESLLEKQYEALKKIKQGYQEYHESKIKPPYLNEAVALLQIPNFFRDNLYIGNTATGKTPQMKDPPIICGLCNVLVDFIISERRSGMSRLMLKAEVSQMCAQLKIENERVCDGVTELNIDILLYIIDNNPDLASQRVCDIVLQPMGCNSTKFDWTVDLPSGQSPSRSQPGNSPSTLKILHVTDIHMDPLYTQNKVKKCDEPVCCQFDQDDGSLSENTGCGYWAEYGNDLSENLIDEMIRFANTLDIDYVYFTGDIISHRVWSTSRENNTATITKLYKKFKDGFKVPVYPILGNHEPSPLNEYEFQNTAPSNLSTKWLYDLIDQQWTDWLPDSTKETIDKGGFYTISPIPGWRLIVLNSNVAYIYCWWLFESDKDPYGQLDWMVRILAQAETNNESVHILSHIPSASSIIHKTWSREYNKIVNRFANTITGQFNGHTHIDQFNVHFNNSNTDQAINVAWNGASLTPFNNGNPSFKVYSVDKDTFNLVDIEEWTFNLTLANQNPDKSPEWYKLYSFRDVYRVPTLRPSDLSDLLVNMATNHSLLADYHIFRFKNSDLAHQAGCDEDCQKGYLCEISTYVFGDTTKCDYLKTVYDNNL